MFRIVTQAVCSRCRRAAPGVVGSTAQYSDAVQQALAKGWTKRRASALYAYQYYCPGCSAHHDAIMEERFPIMELSTDH